MTFTRNQRGAQQCTFSALVESSVFHFRHKISQHFYMHSPCILMPVLYDQPCSIPRTISKNNSLSPPVTDLPFTECQLHRPPKDLWPMEVEGIVIYNTISANVTHSQDSYRSCQFCDGSGDGHLLPPN